MILTRVEGRRLQLLRPLLIDLDEVGIVLGILGTEPQLVRVLNEGREVVRV